MQRKKDTKKPTLISIDTFIKKLSSELDHPEKLTNALVNSMGIIYLNKYSPKRSFLSKAIFPHGNQNSANTLSQCKESNAWRRWALLANVYEKLDGNNYGKLACIIQTAFITAFKQPLIYSVSDSTDVVSLKPSMIASQLKSMYALYYLSIFAAHVEKKEIELIERKLPLPSRGDSSDSDIEYEEDEENEEDYLLRRKY